MSFGELAWGEVSWASSATASASPPIESHDPAPSLPMRIRRAVGRKNGLDYNLWGRYARLGWPRSIE